TGEAAWMDHYAKAGGLASERPRPFPFLIGHNETRRRDLSRGEPQPAEQPQIVGTLMTGEIAAVLVDATVEQKGIPAISSPNAQRHARHPRRRHEPAEGFEEDRRIHIPSDKPH